jgi:hypothetical protein
MALPESKTPGLAGRSEKFEPILDGSIAKIERGGRGDLQGKTQQRQQAYQERWPAGVGRDHIGRKVIDVTVVFS